MKSVYFHLFVSVLLVAGCRSADDKDIAPPAIGAEATAEPLPPDFSRFYERFHADSLYQIEHITWPLAGKIISTGTVAKPALSEGEWERTDWQMHRPITDNADFAQNFTVADPALIIEHLHARSGNYTIERRFAKLGDEWALIYYRVPRLQQ